MDQNNTPGRFIITGSRQFNLLSKITQSLAGRVGGLLNYSDLSSATGTDSRTIKSWISILEASYVIFLLQPHYKKFSKKLVKSPKLYFYDTGVLCYLLRIKQADLNISPYKGQIFESFILGECIKYNKNHRAGLDFYFWRDSKGVEVDLLIEGRHHLIPVELKSGQTLNRMNVF